MSRRRTLMEAVEPRLLFSADPAAPLVEALAPPGSETAVHLDLTPPAVEPRRELVVIDGGVAGYGALVEDLHREQPAGLELEILVLDPSRDGVAQVSEALAGLDAPLDALHLVSHGSTDSLWLGDTRLTAADLGAFESQIAGWQGALAPDADLLVYGCNLAAGEEGRALLARLGELTAADLAASDDVTGAGGDWQLEHRAGALETSVAFSAETRAAWQGRLAATPVGPLIPVNVSTGGNQTLAIGGDNARNVAMAPDGSFAITWSDASGGREIFVRLFNADGSPKTGDLLVNDVTPQTQIEPSIAMADNGDFVVTWAGAGPEDVDGVYARLFNADGSPKDPQFSVNTTLGGSQIEPVVAMDADGDFVVAWWGAGVGDLGGGVFFQRYDASGSPQGSETLVNLGFTTDIQAQPDIAMDASGNFVITWSGRAPGDLTGIWARRFDASGTPQGGRIDVNWETFGTQYAPAVEMADDGRFVIAWSGEGLGETNGVFFRRFDASGNPQGTDQNVTASPALQEKPDLAMDGAGNFTIAWAGSDSGDRDAYIQSYLSDGTADGGTQVANFGFTTDDQRTPSIGMNAAGDFVVAWDGRGPGDTNGIFAQRFERPNTAPVMSPAGPTLPALSEDDTGNPGVLVSTLLGGASDPDPGALGGLALHGLTATSGSWEYDTGSGWTAVGTVTPTSALLLRSSDRIRFVPDGENGGAGTVSYRAWDRTDGGTPGSKIDPGAGGGTSAFSSASDTATVTSSSVNDAPVLDASAPMRFTPLAMNDADPAGDTVATLIASEGGDRITDVDAGAVEGIAVVAVDDSHGTWQYSIDGGASWLSFGSPTTASAVLLEDTARIRFVPDTDFFGPAEGIEFHAWDRSTGSNGQTGVNTTATGGTTAFSSASEEAVVYVTGDVHLLLSTDGDVSAGGQPGFDTWSGNDVVGMGNPGLAFENTAPARDTSGSFSVAFDMDAFGDSAQTNALHWVSRDIQLGTSSFQLRRGDLLLSGEKSGLLLSSESTPSAPGFTNSLTVNETDIFVFRPDTPGDYGSGTFAMLIDNPLGDQIEAFTLIETATTVGDASLDAGDFLLTAKSLPDSILLFETTDVGPSPATSGSLSVLLAGSDPGVGIADKIFGLDLVEEGTVVGGRTLASGTLLVSIKNPDTVGGNGLSVEWSDIFALEVTKTTGVAGAGNGEATASLFFDGSDVAFSSFEERLSGFSLLEVAANSAPILTPSGPSLTGIDEDATANAGDSVASLLGSSVTDSDAGALEGIAVTGLASGGGTWQYSTDAGGSWLAVSAASDANALLLRDVDRLRFVPDGENGESLDPSVTYRAWDRTAGSAGGREDASAAGGSSAFSATTDTATIAVASVNDAPTLGDATLAAVDEDTTNPPGATIDALFGAGFGDVDTGSSLSGIAIVGNTANATTEGVWQYSSDAGANWADVGSVDDDEDALAVSTTTLIRFLPAPDFSGAPPGLVVRGLDDTYTAGFSSTVGGSEIRVEVETEDAGGTSAIADSTNTLSTSINAINDAPTLGDASLAAVDEDTANPPGATIDSLFGAGFGDVDTGASFAGIAVVGNAAPAAEGVWQYSSDAGTTWAAIGAVADDATALAIQATSLLRFVPATDYNGTPTDLVLRGLDDSYAGAWSTTGGGEARVTIDTSSPGGITPITAATSALSTSIDAVNDAPTLGDASLAAVDEDTTNPPGATIDALFGAGFGDVDSGASFAGIAVVGNAAPAAEGVWQYSSDAGTTWAAIGAVADDATALAIEKGSLLRFVPAADFEGAPTDLVLRGLDDSYAGAWSTTGGGETRVTIDTTSPGGITPITAATSILDTSIDAVNDAPTLGDASLAAVDEDTANPPGATIDSLLGAGFGDVDSGASFAGIAVAGNTAPAAEGVWQYSSDAGITWAAIGAVADDATALAIQATSLLRFVPAADFEGAPTDLVLRGLDDSYAGAWSTTGGGEARVTIDTTSPGGITPITAATSALSTSIDAVNDAPTLGDASLAAVDEDTANPPGATIDSLLGAGFGDVDSGASFAGIAVAGNTAPAAEGVWQYSSNSGSDWYAIGAVADDATALAIQATSLLRFVPAADFEGAPTDLVLRGLDDSYAGAWSTTGGGEARVTIDTTSPGGITPITAATSALSTSIDAVNDAPTLGDASLAAVDEDTANPPGATIDSLFGAGFGDVDSGASFAGIAVVGNAAPAAEGVWQYSSNSGSDWYAIGAVADDATALAIQATSMLRFVPAADYNGTPPDLVLRGLDDSYAGAWSTSGGGETRVTIDTTSPGGTTPIAAATSALSTSISALNDAPVLDPSGLMRFSLVAANDADPPGDSVADLVAGAGGDRITDVDTAPSEGIAVVAVDDTHGTWQYSTDGGASWLAFGSVSNTAAVLLDDTARIRFVPDTDYFGPGGGIKFHAWDQTTGSNGQTGVSLLATGGSTAFSADPETAGVYVDGAPTLWLSTVSDVSAGGQPGVDDWDRGDLVGVANPNLAFERTAPPQDTDGTFGVAFDIEAFAPDARTNGVHRVGADIQVGASAFQLLAGDLLLTLDNGETLTSDSTPTAPGFSNSLSVTDEDVFVFRPDTPGDYGSGTFAMLLDNPLGAKLRGLTLVESDTEIGDTTADAGDFLLIRSGGPEENQIWLFDTLDVGPSPATSGAASVLIAGDDPQIAISKKIFGIELIERGTTVGGRTLAEGTLLLALDDADTVGDNRLPVEEFDVFALEVRKTTAGAGIGNGEASASLFFDGSDVAFESGAEKIDGLSLIERPNSAPLLNPASPDFTAIDEDQTGNAGDDVASLLGVTVTDADPGSVTGIAVTGLSSGGGTWQYSTDGGGSWLAVGLVSDANALLLRDVDRLRFVPDGENGESPDPSLTYRAWDRTQGTAGSHADASSPGGESAFSLATDTATIAVASVNDAPGLGGASLAAVDEDTTNPPGATIDSLFGAGFGDVDSGAAFAGIAVVGNAAPAVEGVWQYSSDAGTTWAAIGAVADDATALAVQATSLLRFVPAADFEGAPTDLELRGLDDSYAGSWSTTAAGETRVTVDTSSPGGTTPITAATSTLDTSINAVNDAPTLGDASLAAVDEDTASPPGASIDSLFGAGFGDVDAGAAFAGIAVVGNAAPAAEGVWQYSSDAGASWFAIGAVADDATALAIQATSLLRFLPAADYNGSPTDLVLRGLDDSYAGAWSTTGGGETRVTVDTSSPGGTTPITAATSNLDTSVNPANEAPVLDASGALTLADVTEDDTGPAGNTVAEILASDAPPDRLTDADVGALEGIAVTGVEDANGTWQYQIGVGPWLDVTGVDDANALLLRDGDRLRFVPDPDFDGSANVSFRGWDRSDGALPGTTVDPGTGGGSSAFSLAEASAAVNVLPVNDAPVLDGTALFGLSGVAENDTDPAGNSVAQILASAAPPDRLTDVDTGALEGIAIVAADESNGTWQFKLGAGPWTDVGPVNATSALLLGSGDRLRFVPDTGYAGTAGNLVFRGWDRSDGALAGSLANPGLGGTTSPFSLTPGIATLEVDPGMVVLPDPDPDPIPDPDPDPIPDPPPVSGDPDPIVTLLPEGPGRGRLPGVSAAPPALDFSLASPPARPRLGLELTEETRAAVEDRTGSVRELLQRHFLDSQAALAGELNHLREAMDGELRLGDALTVSSLGLATTLSIGYVVWLTQGGLLVASLVSSMPAWRLIDPLPVLAGRRHGGEDDESLSSMVEGSAGTSELPPAPEPPPEADPTQPESDTK